MVKSIFFLLGPSLPCVFFLRAPDCKLYERFIVPDTSGVTGYEASALTLTYKIFAATTVR